MYVFFILLFVLLFFLANPVSLWAYDKPMSGIENSIKVMWAIFFIPLLMSKLILSIDIDKDFKAKHHDK